MLNNMESVFRSLKTDLGAPGVPPDRPARRETPVRQRAGLPLRAHAALETEGQRR